MRRISKKEFQDQVRDQLLRLIRTHMGDLPATSGGQPVKSIEELLDQQLQKEEVWHGHPAHGKVDITWECWPDAFGMSAILYVNMGTRRASICAPSKVRSPTEQHAHADLLRRVALVGLAIELFMANLHVEYDEK